MNHAYTNQTSLRISPYEEENKDEWFSPTNDALGDNIKLNKTYVHHVRRIKIDLD